MPSIEVYELSELSWSEDGIAPKETDECNRNDRDHRTNDCRNHDKERQGTHPNCHVTGDQ